MRAAWRDRYGGPEVVTVRDIDRPEPNGDQILVRVRAASVNRADLDGLRPRWQWTRAFLGLRRPRNHMLGEDVAGVVEAVGPEVTGFKVGDKVMADLYSLSGGTFAEYVCAPERKFATMPTGMSFEDASTLPHSAVLAIQGLQQRNGRKVAAGEKALIVGASGNVGPFAVQIAKAWGAEVTGVASADKIEFVRSLGADHVIDYRKADSRRTGERYDWVLDVDAHHSLMSWRAALRPKGVYITLGGSTTLMLRMLVQVPILKLATDKSMGMLMWSPFKATDVEALKVLISEGRLKPVIDRVYPLSEVAEALRHVDEGRAKGKVVLVP